MFKDFHRRLQRDLKKIVDARVLASDARLGGEIKVIFLGCIMFTFNSRHESHDHQLCKIDYLIIACFLFFGLGIGVVLFL